MAPTGSVWTLPCSTSPPGPRRSVCCNRGPSCTCRSPSAPCCFSAPASAISRRSRAPVTCSGSACCLSSRGVDKGVVESRLQEVVHLLRPFFRLVLASSTGQPLRGSTLRSIGVSGVIVDLAAIDEPMTRSTLLTQIARVQKESPVVVVHGLFEGEIDDLALRAAGASHMSSRPGGEDGRPCGIGTAQCNPLRKPPNYRGSPPSSTPEVTTNHA